MVLRKTEMMIQKMFKRIGLIEEFFKCDINAMAPNFSFLLLEIKTKTYKIQNLIIQHTEGEFKW